MAPFFSITSDNLTTMFGYIGGIVTDAMPFIVVLLGVLLGIIIVSVIIDLF